MSGPALWNCSWEEALHALCQDAPDYALWAFSLALGLLLGMGARPRQLGWSSTSCILRYLRDKARATMSRTGFSGASQEGEEDHVSQPVSKSFESKHWARPAELGHGQKRRGKAIEHRQLLASWPPLRGRGKASWTQGRLSTGTMAEPPQVYNTTEQSHYCP